MVDNHIQHCIKYEFDRGSNFKIALKNIHDAYGSDSLSDSACRQYFKKLRTEKVVESENSNDSENKSETNDEPENKPLPKPPLKKIPRRGAAPKQHDKPILVKSGFKFIDTQKSEFVIGKEIGTGGFGRIYDAKQTSPKRVVAVKMEPYMNGPLFTEMHVYHKILKEQQLSHFKNENDIEFLGLPSLISSGKVNYEGEDLRYLVIPRYNDSIEAALERNKTFTLAQVISITKAVLYAYQYLHSKNYVHADVKAANLLMEKKNDFDHVFLIDFGLARKLSDELIEKEDKKNAHNGTIEFTSCDAHRGCFPSFRGDLEILTHNILFWLTGKLPWLGESDPVKVFKTKKYLIENVETELPNHIKSKKAMSVVRLFYKVVRKMKFIDRIDVNGIIKLLP